MPRVDVAVYRDPRSDETAATGTAILMLAVTLGGDSPLPVIRAAQCSDAESEQLCYVLRYLTSVTKMGPRGRTPHWRPARAGSLVFRSRKIEVRQIWAFLMLLQMWGGGFSVAGKSTCAPSCLLPSSRCGSRAAFARRLRRDAGSPDRARRAPVRARRPDPHGEQQAAPGKSAGQGAHHLAERA